MVLRHRGCSNLGKAIIHARRGNHPVQRHICAESSQTAEQRGRHIGLGEALTLVMCRLTGCLPAMTSGWEAELRFEVR